MQWLKSCLLPASCLLALTLCTPIVRAQEQIPLKDSRDLLTRGIELNDKSEYKEAMALYRQVPEGDTNYAIALNEMVLTDLSDSAFVEARDLAKQGLMLPNSPNHREFLLYLGHAYDYLGQRDSAMRCYDSLISLNPNDYQPLFEKGTVYLRGEQYDAAMHYFRQSLLRNPYHFASHKGMSLALVSQGRLGEAYLAASTALFTTNNTAQAHQVIAILNNIREETDEVAGAYKKRDPEHNDPAFDEIDAIVNGKLPQSKDYKYESDLSGDGIINDLHAIMEKVRYDADDTSFVMQYYVPLYRQAYKDGQFDPFVLFMYAGYNIDVVDRLAKKNKSDMKDIKAFIFSYLDKIAATRKLNFGDRKTAKEQYAWFPSESIYIVGAVKSKDPLLFNEGPVVVYKGGNLLTAGRYNASSEKEGEWKSWYPGGALHTRENYKAGKYSGEAVSYYPNGNMKEFYVFDNGEQLEERDYTYNGVLNTISKKKGEDHVLSSYFTNGAKRFSGTVHGNDLVDGHYKYYYDNGIMSKEFDLADAKKEGLFKEYYPDGTLNEQTRYEHNKRQGEYFSYHPNGKMHFKAGYSNDKLDGPYEEYNEAGKLINKGAYHNGKKTGEEVMLTPDGRQYGTITYKNDAPYGYRYTDESGKVLAENSDGRDFSKLVVYSASGVKLSDVPYQHGKADGVAKYYFNTGGLLKTITYSEDKKDGPVKEYYRNGKLKWEQNYKGDEADGYYKYYYSSGRMHGEGWLKAGQKQGVWRYYSAAGRLEEELFFLDDERNGPDKNYLHNGKLHYRDIYDKGMLVGMCQYDTAGREIARENFPQGNGSYSLKYANGRPSFVSGLKHGLYEGAYTKYLPDGTLVEKGFFRNGVSDSTAEGYAGNGRVQFKGKFKDGKRTGLWQYYDVAGNKTREMNYAAGEREGGERVWEGGIVRYEYNFHHDEKNGAQTIYGDEGKAACVLMYDEGELTGYTSAGKDGKLLPVTPVKNGTANIATFYPDGSKAAVLPFRDNIADGRQIIYYSNGQIAEERSFAGNDFMGPYRNWTASGKPLYDAVYKDDEIDGKELIYDATGALISSRQFIEGGILHGPCVYTDPKTKKSVTVHYQYGQPVNVL